MKTARSMQDSFRARVAVFGNPYRFVELDEAVSTSEEKRAYCRTLQNPYASLSLLDELEDQAPCAKPAHSGAAESQFLDLDFDRAPDLGPLLDEVLSLYRPYVAKNQWSRVTNFREEFLGATANLQTGQIRVIANRLAGLKFTPLPGEKVEYNRAPADGIIAELKELLAD